MCWDVSLGKELEGSISYFDSHVLRFIDFARMLLGTCKVAFPRFSGEGDPHLILARLSSQTTASGQVLEGGWMCLGAC